MVIVGPRHSSADCRPPPIIILKRGVEWVACVAVDNRSNNFVFRSGDMSTVNTGTVLMVNPSNTRLVTLMSKMHFVADSIQPALRNVSRIKFIMRVRSSGGHHGLIAHPRSSRYVINKTMVSVRRK